MKTRLAAIVALLFSLPALAQLRVTQTATATAYGPPMVATFGTAPTTGDLLVAVMGYYSGADPLATPTGWTLLKQQYGNGAGGTTGFTSFTHFVATGEANSYSFPTGGNKGTVTVLEIAGADAYHPVSVVGSNVQTLSTASAATPALTPLVAGSLPIAAIATEGGAPVTGVSTSGWAYVAPASTSQHTVGAAYGPLTSGTAPVAATFTTTTADSYGLAAFTLLVAPAGTTGHIPTAAIGELSSGVIGIPVGFDGSASVDPRYETLTYAWSFGDGTTGTGATPTHTYSATGTLTVSLTVTDADGYASAPTSSPLIVGLNCSVVSLGPLGALNGYVPSPADAWHADLTNAPVDPLSDTILLNNTTDLAGSYLHPDFGGGGVYGIPYTVVDSSVTPPVPVQVNAYAGESDLAMVPFDAGTLIESAPADCSDPGTADHHALLFDKHSCAIIELYHAQRCLTGSPARQADSETIWDSTKTARRPYGLTSADAAGLSIFAGLVRYEEVQAGHIDHAIRFTALHTKNDTNNGYFTYPATHASGQLYGSDLPQGTRLRLKPGYDLSSLGPQSRTIGAAMKTHGLMLADLGGNLYFQGTPDTRWDDNDLNGLKSIPASAFEVVDGPGQGPLATSYAPGTASFYPNGKVYDSENHPTGPAPTATLTASATTILPGQSVTLTPTANGSYSYLDRTGLVRGPITLTPQTTQTYTLTTRNLYGSATSTVTIVVAPTVTVPFLWFRP